jgi:hypothetical protein
MGKQRLKKKKGLVGRKREWPAQPGSKLGERGPGKEGVTQGDEETSGEGRRVAVGGKGGGVQGEPVDQ